ncbi:MAG TPA: LysE family transporter, partial [Magnetovibrio sp.]
GAAFLFIYGVLAFRRAWVGEALNNGSDAPPARTLKSALLTALAFSLLNPHALLDTVVLLGSISGQYAWDGRVWFLGGAVCASFAWFFTLAVAAGYLAPLFKKPATWRVLDALIGCVMWAIAASLINGAFL